MLWSPNPSCITFAELEKWGGEVGKVLDEAHVVASQTKECGKAGDIVWWGHCADRRELRGVRFNAGAVGDMSKEAEFLEKPEALVRAQTHVAVAEALQDGSRLVTVVSRSFPNHTQSSRYTTTVTHKRPAMVVSMRRWKIAGALFQPKGRTVNR